MMKALVCTSPGSFEYEQIDIPEMQPGNAIIKVKRIGICGTDLHAYKGTQPYFSYPRILGHELAAEFIEAKHANGFIAGEALTFIPYLNCNKCIACINGKSNCCVDMKVVGVHIDGGMTEYLSIPADKLVKSQGLVYDELAMVEPMAIGAHGIRRAEVKKDEFVLVCGAGPIGLCTMEFARIAGGNVIALDINEKRLKFCNDKLNIKFCINASQENVITTLTEITNGNMPTVVIDATGNRSAINSALQYLAHGGRYVLIGLQKEEISFSHPEFHKRESTLMSSRNATREDFEHVIRSIKSGLVKPLDYITHRVMFSKVKDEFEKLMKPETEVIKAIIETE